MFFVWEVIYHKKRGVQRVFPWAEEICSLRANLGRVGDAKSKFQPVFKWIKHKCDFNRETGNYQTKNRRSF